MPLPHDKQFALAVTVDFDAQAAWLAKGKNDPAILARGEFGAEVGVPRLLDIFDRYRIPTTWGIPGHSIMTWPDRCKAVLAGGHEICAHGVYHENLTDMPEPIERKLMEHQIQQHLDVLGTRPRGYRAPSGTMTHNTFTILEDFGFDWHSSLSGRDFEPYHPREIKEINLHGATVFGRPYRVLEFPTSWFLEDWVAFEYVGGYSMGLSDTDVVLRRWTDSLDYGLKYVRPGVMTLVLHPQSIGRPHHMMMLDRFLEYATSLPELWIATLSDIFDAWTAPAAPAAPAE
ncbi:polysaccharide deacetylase [Microbispora sp. NPDC046933]|uniref:polysaccharide deacetylase family protein n=1 Tax=Microbispora sp. NPDC046933 TaxID=3155618 RepID=UPI003400CD04